MESSIHSQQATTVCNDLLELLTAYKLQLTQIAEAHGLTSMQLFALRSISDGANATGKIALTMHCDASNVTGIVDRLITLKLATRKEGTHDRRVKTIELTKKGRTVLLSALELLPSRLHCDRLTTAEAQHLHTIAEKLIAA